MPCEARAWRLANLLVEVACHAQVVAVLLEAGGELATVLRVVAVESSAPVSLRRIAENRPRLRPGDSIGVGPCTDRIPSARPGAAVVHDEAIAAQLFQEVLDLVL